MHAVVVIGASAGGFEPLRRIIAALAVPCTASVYVVMHIGSKPSVLPSLLDRPGLPAGFAQDGTLIEAGHIYVAPPDHHMFLERHSIRLSHGPKVHHTRPAIDPLFVSAIARQLGWPAIPRVAGRPTLLSRGSPRPKFMGTGSSASFSVVGMVTALPDCLR